MRLHNHRRLRKLFFPFGIITLAIFPIFGFQKIAEIYRQKTAPLHCIELNFPASDTITWGKQTGEKYSEIRKYTTYKLSADDLQNGIILNQARERLNKIKSNRDTLNGVHIIFNDSTMYQDYIKAVDYSFEKFPGAFASYQNDFWSMYVYIDTTGWYQQKLQREWDRTHDVKY
ncbi:MAG: hypothetical protein V4547_02600 [Bacteroidota bacterium]